MIRGAFLLALGLAAAGCQIQQPSQSTSSAEHHATATDNAAATNPSELSEAVLHIDGMVCHGCAEAAQTCLTELAGVASADVSLEQRSARVHYDATKTSPLAMVAALEAVDRGEATPFRVTVGGVGQ